MLVTAPDQDFCKETLHDDHRAYPLRNRRRGYLQLEFFEDGGEAFVKKDPRSAASLAAIEKVIEYVHRELG